MRRSSAVRPNLTAEVRRDRRTGVRLSRAEVGRMLDSCTRLREVASGRVLPVDAWTTLQAHQTGITPEQARAGIEMLLAKGGVFEVVD